MKRTLLALIAAAFLVGCGKKEPALDIWTAAATGSKGVIKQHIAVGTNLDLKEPSGGSSPLIMAAIYGQTDTAQLLVESGAGLNLANNDGSTPLHVAAFFGHPDTVAYLLKAGADTTLRNNFGHTPLESVSGEWTSELEDVYRMFAGMLQMELDLDQLRAVRPRIAEMIRQASAG